MRRPKLARNLSLFSATMIGVGAMIGAGIFVLTGIAAGIAGPALLLTFLLNGIVAVFTASAYAELGGVFPEAGGGYLWVKTSLPQPMGFLSGWMSWMAHSVACSVYAVGFGAYFAEFLGEIGINTFIDVAILKKIFAVIIVSIFTYINYRGAKETGKAGNVITLLKIAILLFFISIGLGFIVKYPSQLSNFTPFVPKGFIGIFMAMGLTYIAFEGYEIIAQSGEEIVDPVKNIPRAIFYSLLIVVPFYIFVGFVAIGSVKPGNMTAWDFLALKKEIALIESARNISSIGGIIIMIGGLLSTISALNATIYSSSRVSFAMGRDFNLPEFFFKVHSRFKTPSGALFSSYIIIVLMSVFLPVEDIASSADIMFLFLFILVNISLIHLRRKRKEVFKGYKSPLFPLFPVLGIITQFFLLTLMFIYSPKALFVTLLWLGGGISIYYSYSRFKEKEYVGPQVIVEEREPVRKEFRVLVGVKERQNIENFLKIAVPVAKEKDGEIIITHILNLPHQTPLNAGKRLIEKRRQWLEKGDEIGERKGVPVSFNILISHDTGMAVVDSVNEYKANVLFLGVEAESRRKILGRILDPVLQKSDSDIGLLRARRTDLKKINKIIVPTAGGPNAKLALEWGIMIAKEHNAKIDLVYVIRDEKEHPIAEKWISETEKNLKNVNKYVKEKIVEGNAPFNTLLELSNNYDLMILGASNQGFLKRVRFGTLPEKILRKTKIPLLIARKYEGRVLSWVRRFLNG